MIFYSEREKKKKGKKKKRGHTHVGAAQIWYNKGCRYRCIT